VKKIIIDMLGGDNGYDSTLSGSMMALKKNAELNLLMLGDTETINNYFAREPELLKRVEIVQTTTNIQMCEQPTVAIRTKADSSIVLGMTALKNREDCGAFVSAGSTGAILTGAILKLGRVAGVSRPALSPFLPTIDGRGVLLLDAGSNMDCKPVNLVHFAVMADVFLQSRGITNPRIALLSVGTEDEKGNELVKATLRVLRELQSKRGLNFVGNMEAREALGGEYDAIVTDGFAGNVLLKCVEGTAKMFSKRLKTAISGPSVLLGKIILGGRLKKMRREFGDDALGGALFLGVKKPVIKAHGNAKPTTMCNAILYGATTGNMDLEEKISQKINVDEFVKE
jgi:glycerol-3-phosphate acyltransferase PlsX